jgi:hypothetical protein
MDKMTISQGLRRIAKLKGQYKELADRAAASINYMEETPPAFKFVDSMLEMEKVRLELVGLWTSVRYTNAVTMIDFHDQKMSLVEATVRLQEVKGRIAFLRNLQATPQKERTVLQQEIDRTTHQYVSVKHKQFCDFTEVEKVTEIKKDVDFFDDLNDAVESANHRTVLRMPE